MCARRVVKRVLSVRKAKKWEGGYRAGAAERQAPSLMTSISSRTSRLALRICGRRRVLRGCQLLFYL